MSTKAELRKQLKSQLDGWQREQPEKTFQEILAEKLAAAAKAR